MTESLPSEIVLHDFTRRLIQVSQLANTTPSLSPLQTPYQSEMERILNSPPKNGRFNSNRHLLTGHYLSSIEEQRTRSIQDQIVAAIAVVDPTTGTVAEAEADSAAKQVATYLGMNELNIIRHFAKGSYGVPGRSVQICGNGLEPSDLARLGAVRTVSEAVLRGHGWT